MYKIMIILFQGLYKQYFPSGLFIPGFERTAGPVLSILLCMVTGSLWGSDFSNVAPEAGLGWLNATRCKWVDIDAGGWQDLVLLVSNPPTSDGVVLLRCEAASGVPRFSDMTASSAIHSGGKRPVSLLLAGDADNNGFPDLFCGVSCDFEKPRAASDGAPLAGPDGRILMAVPDHGFRSSLMLNTGKGGFSPAADGTPGSWPATVAAACFLDFDRDGLIDLFVGNWYRRYGFDNSCYPSRLFKGSGDGSFTDVTASAGILLSDEPGSRSSSRPVYGASHCDWNNDGWEDILVCAYGRQWNILWKNNGDGTFSDAGERTHFDGDDLRDGTYPTGAGREPELPYRSNGNTFDAACADFDNDGDFDVFLSEITHSWAGPSSDLSCLLVNAGPEWVFTRDQNRGIDRRHEHPKWNQGDLHATWLDYDNDMLPDLLLASSDYPDRQILRLFRQTPDHRFSDVTASAGIGIMNPTQPSTADFDRDGDLDIVVGTTNMRLTPEQVQSRPFRLSLFRNEIGNRNSWIGFRLHGKGRGFANAQGIGALIRVTVGGVTQTREIFGGQGHCGHQDAQEAHFGLADHAIVDRVEIIWPNASRSTDVFERIPARRWYDAHEGKNDLEPFTANR